MEPWYKVAMPRVEVREGRSFNPDEFAIALEQVVAGTAPADYRDPAQFFARTCFTRALREHTGMVLRRLAGRTENSAPVLTFITQFGGGKTHTLTALYHLVGQASGLSSQAGSLRHKIAEWTKQRGKSPRLYPGSLVWCVRKPGRGLKDKVEMWLAWRRVEREINDGTLGGDFDRADRTEVTTKVRDAEEAAKDEVWASYRFVVLADSQERDGLKTIDLGAGHASASETLCGRVITALKSQALLNESPGAGYLERRWPPAFKESGAWPLTSLRQAFLTGAMERLIDPDAYLRGKIPEFVLRGDFGLASGHQSEGGYSRVWFAELLPPEEVAFDADVYLLTKAKAKALKAKPETQPATTEAQTDGALERSMSSPLSATSEDLFSQPETGSEPLTDSSKKTVRISGTIPPEVWNRLGTKLLPKLRAGSELRVGLDLAVGFDADTASALQLELRQILGDLNLTEQLRVEVKETKS